MNFLKVISRRLEKLTGRISTYLLGCILFSIGAKFFINSNLGVDPLDTIIIGLANYFNCKIGTVSALVAIGFLLVWSVWNKRKPIITPFITMTLVGYLIDLWNYLVPNSGLSSLSESWVIMLIGLLICAYSSSLIIMSGIGVRTMDLVALTMVNKLRLPFFVSKGIIETSFIVSGILLHGPFGVGTFAFLFFVGPLIQPFIYINQLVWSSTNYGLGTNEDLI